MRNSITLSRNAFFKKFVNFGEPSLFFISQDITCSIFANLLRQNTQKKILLFVAVFFPRALAGWKGVGESRGAFDLGKETRRERG